MEQKHTIGEGTGLAGRYAGLPDPFGNKDFAKIAVLPVPFDKTTTYQKGSDKGPEAIIEASRNMELYDIETNSEVYQQGIFTAPFVEEDESEAMLESVYQKTKELLENGKFVVTLGGEHSISYAPAKAHAEHFGLLSVLQFDAHADLQEAYEGNPWSHASAMKRVKEIPNVHNIVSVGIRSMSAEELPYLDRSNTFFSHLLSDEDKSIDDIIERLHENVYITFDLDALDPGIMPSTGTPEPGGLSWNFTMKLLKRVAEKKVILGFDVVELCPIDALKAPDYLAAKLIYKLLSYKYHSR